MYKHLLKQISEDIDWMALGPLLLFVLVFAGVVRDELGRVHVEGFVHGRHAAHAEQVLDDLARLEAHGVGEIAHRDRAVQWKRLLMMRWLNLQRPSLQPHLRLTQSRSRCRVKCRLNSRIKCKGLL